MSEFTDSYRDQMDRAATRAAMAADWHYTKPTKRLERTSAEVLVDLADKRAAQRFSAEPCMLTGWGEFA
jgi:hypothetical protein